jgi:hypothetical protein
MILLLSGHRWKHAATSGAFFKLYPLRYQCTEVGPGELPSTIRPDRFGNVAILEHGRDLRLRIYIRQLECWDIEVVGLLPGFGIPILTLYTVLKESMVDLAFYRSGDPR